MTPACPSALGSESAHYQKPKLTTDTEEHAGQGHAPHEHASQGHAHQEHILPFRVFFRWDSSPPSLCRSK